MTLHRMTKSISVITLGLLLGCLPLCVLAINGQANSSQHCQNAPSSDDSQHMNKPCCDRPAIKVASTELPGMTAMEVLPWNPINSSTTAYISRFINQAQASRQTLTLLSILRI